MSGNSFEFSLQRQMRELCAYIYILVYYYYYYYYYWFCCCCCYCYLGQCWVIDSYGLVDGEVGIKEGILYFSAWPDLRIRTCLCPVSFLWLRRAWPWRRGHRLVGVAAVQCLSIRRFHDRSRGSLAGQYFWGGLVSRRCVGLRVYIALKRFWHWCQLSLHGSRRVALFKLFERSGWFSSLNETTTRVLPVINPVHNTRFLQRTILRVQFRSLQTECGEPNCRSVTTPEATCKFQM
jgi:hypothetical protein